jgi:hypothetical protein
LGRHRSINAGDAGALPTKDLTMTPEVRRNTRFRRFIALLGTAVVMFVGAAFVAPAASAEVTVGGIDAGAAGSYSCSAHEVQIAPWVLYPVGADSGVWALAQVYDRTTGVWLASPQWYRVDGITTLTFTVNDPALVAYVNYARYVGGQWQITREMIDITPDLDNAPPFC